jgi:predicted glycosyltransferase
VRDILEPRALKKNQRIVELVKSHFDLVLVHADPAIVDFGESFPPVRRIAEKLRYTGFVVDAKSGQETSARASGEVVVSAGGGVVGEALLETALRAQPLSRLKHLTWRVLVGPAVEEAAYRRLQALAAPGARGERNRADFASLLQRGRVSISQAGYNTLLDVVQARIPAVVVPFTDGRHREQPTRARLFERRGLVRVLEPDGLDPEKLAEAVDLAADSDPAPAGMLDLNGADNAADIVLTALAVLSPTDF